LATFRVRQCRRGCNTLVVRDRWEPKIRRYFILLLLLLLVVIIIIIRGGQLVATERAGGVAMEPLKDAVLVEDVGAGHGAEPCHRLYISCCCCWLPLVLICRISQSLKADGTVVSVVVHGGEQHVLEPQDSLGGGRDASTLARRTTVMVPASGLERWRWRSRSG
jgi:hypothetical protein